MIVISDTSPLNYLILIDAIEVLPRLFPAVLAPEEVIAELAAAGAHARVREWASRPPAWLQVRRVGPFPEDLKLGQGEAAAIHLALALRVSADVRLLMDDRAGREAAHRVGLITRGTLAVIAEAGAAGLLDVAESIQRLRATSFHASDELYEEVLRRSRGTHS